MEQFNDLGGQNTGAIEDKATYIATRRLVERTWLRMNETPGLRQMLMVAATLGVPVPTGLQSGLLSLIAAELLARDYETRNPDTAMRLVYEDRLQPLTDDEVSDIQEKADKFGVNFGKALVVAQGLPPADIDDITSFTNAGPCSIGDHPTPSDDDPLDLDSLLGGDAGTGDVLQHLAGSVDVSIPNDANAEARIADLNAKAAQVGDIVSQPGITPDEVRKQIQDLFGPAVEVHVVDVK